MTLWDALEHVLDGLADRGWRALLLRHGLDIAVRPVSDELLRALAGIDRTLTGFLDFAPQGRRAIEPGDPARSLLYHALASPLVHPTTDGTPGPSELYPSLQDLDTLENLIYALAAPSVSIAELVPAVFAYEYRPAYRTPHGQHADLVFARTGIARFGTTAAHYERALRCHVGAAGSPSDVRAMPARYGLFLARRIAGRASWSTDRQRGVVTILGGPRRGDGARDFLVPVHKLFSGSECLEGANLEVELRHRHVGEKLRRACTVRHGIRVDEGFDLNAPPFVIVSDDSDPRGPVRLERFSGSALVNVAPAPLVRLATQRNAVTGEETTVPFRVPEETIIALVNRRFTSLRIADDWAALADEGVQSYIRELFEWLRLERFPRPRNAPEFVNIRHRLNSETGELEDMRSEPADRDRFLEEVEEGRYEAVLFVDSCADGCVTARFDGWPLGPAPRALPAFSVVASPDFFPAIDQVEISEWLDSLEDPNSQFRQGGPDPLCYGRLPANLDLVDPVTGGAAFASNEETMVAIVSAAPRGTASPPRADVPRRTSFLSDASSNVFAPGWDVTYAAHDDGPPYYATYGLGSPFAEDVKLCASANSFWPAVSPDAARTFGRTDTPTATPLTDAELGYHRLHPWVLDGSVGELLGWDGEQGPFLAPDGEHVDFADIERSDYVSNVLDGRVAFDRLAAIDAEQMIFRMDCLRRAVAEADDGSTPARTSLLLVSLEPIADWSLVLPDASLSGLGFRFLFALPTGAAEPAAGDPMRMRQRVRRVVRCRVDETHALLEVADPGPDALALYEL